MKTIGHHTCKQDGGKHIVQENAPFLSVITEDGKLPFLGEGYYYWDNNISLAHFWGKVHYNNLYFIQESELNLSAIDFFDLTGNRQHMIDFLELYNHFKKKSMITSDWPVGKFIEFLKDLQSQEHYTGIFPYKVIRATDISVKNEQQFLLKFVSHRGNYTNLSPRLVICVINKKNIILRSKLIEEQVA